MDDQLVKTIEEEVFHTASEEVANAITHGIGAGLSIAGLTLMVVFAAFTQDFWRITSVTIFGVSMVLCYLASTLYHAFQAGKFKRLFRKLDHAAIYLLIAGTYTPFLLVHLRNGVGVGFFIFIWSFALIGIIFKLFFIGKFSNISTLVYVLMGWLVVIIGRPLAENVPEGGLNLLIAGGLSYTLGVIFYAWRKLPYNHAIWHLFVIGGSICHFFSVLLYVVPTGS